jgi:NAD(P)-dependent dehydrogenase (short-subunit alcohol dehydrogenase family)
MRRQREGLLPWIGSGSTRAIPPYLGPYAIAKAAFDALAESFAWDVESLRIDTTIIHPGVFTQGTSHFTDAARANDAARASEYDRTPAERHLDSMLEDTERLLALAALYLAGPFMHTRGAGVSGGGRATGVKMPADLDAR